MLTFFQMPFCKLYYDQGDGQVAKPGRSRLSLEVAKEVFCPYLPYEALERGHSVQIVG